MSKNQIVEATGKQSGAGVVEPTAPMGDRDLENNRQLRRLLLAGVVLVVCFSKPLFDLGRYVLNSELYSHVLLIPFVSFYLVWIKRDISSASSTPFRPWAILPLALGIISLVVYWIAVGSDWPLRRNDTLAMTTFSFVSFFIAACIVFLGRQTVRSIAFPLGFLFFMVPFPTVVENWIEIFFQHTSAFAAHAMLSLAGTPVFRDGLSFQMPGVRLLVAQECSGIRSSLVLFITSLIAGNLFLKSPGKRAILALAVIPLAIIRNGFRIFTIAELCIHISPDMLDSFIHRRGGPIFFLLSLVPFFLLLFLLRKLDFSAKAVPATNK